MGKRELKNIKTKIFERGFSLARTGLKSAQLAAGQFVQSKWSRHENNESHWTGYLTKQAELLATEFGQLKGSAMKIGQLISTYGEHFLPPEANQWLKSLQFQSPTLSWPKIQEALSHELGDGLLSKLEIDPAPLAAASIGQVHRARIKASGDQIVLKIQYPGVDGAIDTDLKFLRAILSVGPLLPKGPRFNLLFDEVREMLHNEVNYLRELELTQMIYDRVKGDHRCKVPQPYPEFSSRKVLALEYVPGTPIDDPQVKGLDLTTKNKLGEYFLDLYLRELTEFQIVQTDPHFGNYRLDLSPGKEKLILFDFGASREVPDSYLKPFLKIVLGGINNEDDLILAGGGELKLIEKEDPLALVQLYLELCHLATEPFADNIYDWQNSDLPKRVAIKGAEVIKQFHLRAPPRETIFLDRKLGGTFTFLSTLGCKANWRSLVLNHIRSAAARFQIISQSP